MEVVEVEVGDMAVPAMEVEATEEVAEAGEAMEGREVVVTLAVEVVAEVMVAKVEVEEVEAVAMVVEEMEGVVEDIREAIVVVEEDIRVGIVVVEEGDEAGAVEVAEMAIGFALIQAVKYELIFTPLILALFGNQNLSFKCSCGNLNFARRVECNKCGTPSPTGSGERGGGGGGAGGGYNRGESGGNYGSNRGGRGGYFDSGRNEKVDGGRSGGNRGNSYGTNREREDGNYGQVPPPAPPSYSGAGVAYPPPYDTYGGNADYGTDAVPPPRSYTGGPMSYPPSYTGSMGSYDGEKQSEARSDSGRGRGGASSGYDSGHGSGSRGSYGSTPASDSQIKQCDGNCTDSCDNSRIYISNLPPDVTIDELKDLFGGIGQVGRIKQKRGYKDQWPWNIKIYTDEMGNNKGDAVLSYEDPSAAHSAGGFFNDYDMRGYKISVAMAEKTAPKGPPAYNHGGGGRGGYGGGGDRRRDNYRDGGGSGPDRHQHGGNRSRPY